MKITQIGDQQDQVEFSSQEIIMMDLLECKNHQ
jgi:hypothetical protein